MTQAILDLFGLYGLPAAALVLALGQFGIPMPTSLVLLMIGALSAQGDSELAIGGLWAVGGAVAGDQAGFQLGRSAAGKAGHLSGRLGQLMQKTRKAEAHVKRWGGSGVFISRWLVTPLGPAVNIASGATGLGWTVFTFWGVAGEVLWVAIYVGIGYGFSSNIETLAGILGNFTLALAFLAIAAAIGWKLYAAFRVAASNRSSNSGNARRVMTDKDL